MSKEKSIPWLKNPDGTPGKSWNPAPGCNGKCLYCYARPFYRRFCVELAVAEMKYKYGHEWFLDKPAQRFSKYREKFVEYKSFRDNFKNFIPTFRPSVLAQKLRKKPTMYFFSMTDPVWWKDEWYKKILEKICQHKQHTFIILTKQPTVYMNYTFPCNCWLGVTVENQYKLGKLELDLCGYDIEIPNKFFLSIEPIQSPIKISGFMLKQLDWITIGPETGKRKEKIISPPAWIEYFYKIKTPVFMKQSCEKILGEHGKGKCEKDKYGIGGEYGHGYHDDSEYLTDENNIIIKRCGRCHGKMLRQEWPEGYMGE